MDRPRVDMYLTDEYSKKSNSLPNQRVSRKTKNSLQWQKDSIDFFIDNRRNTGSSRKSQKEIEENWDFYNKFLSEEAMKNTLDPLDVENTLNKEEGLGFQFYDILDQPFDTLFGEELKRRSEVKAYAINPQIVNQKDYEFKQKVKEYLNEIAQDPTQQIDKEAFQEKLKELDKFKKFDLQSAHEVMMNDILQALNNDNSLNLKLKFNEGFKNQQIASEQIYRVGHSGKELTFEKVNSANFYVLGLGDSHNIADAYAWIEVDYINPYKLIEEFSEELTDKEIDKIFELSVWSQNGIGPQRIGMIQLDPNSPLNKAALPLVNDGEFIMLDGSDSGETDADGNIKVYRLQWVSLRKLGYLTYFDEDGDEQHEWVDEYYTPDVTQGETVKWIWVKEIWEGNRIGNDIYKKVRPCPVQMRSSINPSMVRPSYVGYVLSNNGKSQKSRIDKLRPYQNMYNVWANKLVKLFTEHIGKAAVIDIARIPEEMSTEEWYLWLKRFNIAFENSMSEGKKGAAKGQLVGNMQQNSKVLDLSLAADINQAIQTLTWIEERVNKIAAVPSPRQGDMQGNEGLGISQQAIVQSSHQTELDFTIHDLIKSQCYEVMLEYIKVLWKDEKGKRQFILDDLSSHLIEIDGELLTEIEVGVAITNSSQLMNMYMAIQQLSHAAMQTGTATLTDIAKMYMATSPSQMLYQLEEAEDKRIQQQNEQERMRQETMQQQMASQKELALLQHQQELEKINLEWQYKLQIAQMQTQLQFNAHLTDTNQNNIEDAVELEKQNILVEGQKQLQATEIASKEKIVQLELANKEKIERIKADSKPKTTGK